MPPIYINTDNSDKKHKIYIASLAGNAVDAAETKMQEMVVKAFEKQSDFTTNKTDNPKGYTLIFKLTKFSSSGGETSCTIDGDIVRYPSVATKKSGSGAEKVMFGGNFSISASVSGGGNGAAIQCVEAIMEPLVPKAIPVMKSDMGRR